MPPVRIRASTTTSTAQRMKAVVGLAQRSCRLSARKAQRGLRAANRRQNAEAHAEHRVERAWRQAEVVVEGHGKQPGARRRPRGRLEPDALELRVCLDEPVTNAVVVVAGEQALCRRLPRIGAGNSCGAGARCAQYAGAVCQRHAVKQRRNGDRDTERVGKPCRSRRNIEIELLHRLPNKGGKLERASSQIRYCGDKRRGRPPTDTVGRDRRGALGD